VRTLATASLIGAAFLDSFFVTCAITDDAMAPTVSVDMKITKHKEGIEGNSGNNGATPVEIVARNEESLHLAARR
jgi:hypothetical protein